MGATAATLAWFGLAAGRNVVYLVVTVAGGAGSNDEAHPQHVAEVLEIGFELHRAVVAAPCEQTTTDDDHDNDDQANCTSELYTTRCTSNYICARGSSPANDDSVHP